MLLACVDVDYRPDEAVAACLAFREFGDEVPCGQWLHRQGPAAAYQPGEFYLRELPCLIGVLAQVPDPLHAVLIDGYAWLGPEHPGLGAHLHQALGGQVPVIGVAKTRYHAAELAVPVLRGQSQSPLYVTAAGMDPREAAEKVREMHGPHRVPTLLRLVDRLAREG